MLNAKNPVFILRIISVKYLTYKLFKIYKHAIENTGLTLDVIPSIIYILSCDKVIQI